MKYEAPAVTAITEVGEPLIGVVVGSVTNPQWNDEADAS
jgi:hypothetical protein